MAVKNETSSVPTSATGRRLFFGTNVLVVVLLATAILVGVNLIGHRKNLRRDVAGGFTSYRLSDRTKRVLEKAPEGLRITTIYTSDEPDTNRKEYLPRLQDYLDEMRQFKKSITVQHLHTGNERAELRNRVQGKFGEAAEKYKETIEFARQVWGQFRQVVENQQQLVQAQLRGRSWLSGFTSMANINTILTKDLEEIGEVEREVNNLITGEGMPRYQEANNKIKTANDAFKQHVESVQTWMKEMDKLAKALSDPNSEFARKTQENLAVMQGLVLNLRKEIGAADDREVPSDPTPLLKNYTKAANTLATWLFEESSRLSAFVKENPAIQQHPKWQVRVSAGFMEASLGLDELLQEASQALTSSSDAVRQTLVRSSTDELAMKNMVVKLRQATRQVEQFVSVSQKNLTELLAEAGTIDEASKTFLAQGSSGELFKAPPSAAPNAGTTQPAETGIIEQLTSVSTKIGELPKLELDEIGDKFKEENIVVVETEKAVKVVPFDEVWPPAAPDAAQFGDREKETKLRRVFDGDGAIAGVVLGLVSDKKVATVIVTGFETEPPPQMRQFQRGNTGPIPMGQLTVLKERLERANFAVKDWNLSGGGGGPEGQGQEAKVPDPPAPEEGTEPIYLFLPPASAPPMNPMMQQMPPPAFGEEQLAQVRKVLANKGRAVFLAISDAMPRRMFDPPPSFEFDQYLQGDWGIQVKFDYRVIRGVRDREHPDRFGIDPIEWGFLPLSNFTDQPIGAPLKARRLLMASVCPVEPVQNLPEGVKVDTVLRVAETAANDIWAEKDLLPIVSAVTEGRDDSTFTQGADAMQPPFPVILAAENAKTGSRIVVMGTGFSFVDGYLERPVPRFQGKQSRFALATDPPPKENVDLALNTLYWLAERPEMIAAGPAPVPRIGPIDKSGENTARFVTYGWAFVILFVGMGMLLVRRK